MPRGGTQERLELQGTRLRCLAEAGERWSVEVCDLILIAEYTTDEGPYADDYFLVFVSLRDGKLVSAECSLYAQGRDEAMHALGERLGDAIAWRLFGSTVWASNVLWPPSLAGAEYLTLSAVQPAGWGAWWRRLLRGQEHERRLSDGVRAYLGGRLTGLVLAVVSLLGHHGR